MPRARTTDSEDVVVVKKPRAPRARATSMETMDAPAPRKRAPRKTTPKKAIVTPEPVSEPEVAPTPQRKAPTSIAAERLSKARNTKMFIFVIVFCVLLTGAGVTVGLFDNGAIDVVAVVNTRNEQINRGEVRDASGQVITNTVAVQEDRSGLHAPDPSAPVQPPPPATTTSSDQANTTNAATGTAATSSTATPSATSTPAS